jgi:hypothetical protein
MKKALSLVFVGFGAICSWADAYEIETHAIVTQRAHEISMLATDSELLRELGIVDRSNAFGVLYNDMNITFDEVETRASTPFEQRIVRAQGIAPLSVGGWLMQGAIREDDAAGEDNPQDDPYPANRSLRRPLNHFYDPVFDRPLTVAGVNVLDSRKAPDWAIGALDVFGSSNVAEINRRNHFTFFDAREAMYRALTGTDKKGKNVAGLTEERNKYWATTFRALGGVVHIVQDMGQPQHTRNDQHAGKFPESVTGHKSVYEAYTNARAIGLPSVSIDGQATVPSPLIEDGYPNTRFTNYADFFSTARRDGVEGGLGLADYSNRGFFTAGTNLGANDYALPPNDRHQFAEQVVSVNSDTKTVYLLDGVFDRLNSALRVLDVRKTKESLWYEPLLEFADAGIAETFGYTLDQRIYDAQADLLIPRAVAYSAGLIDYFFRGRLEVIDPTFTDEGVNLKVKNAIDVEKVPEWENENLYAQKSQGQFVVTVKYKQGGEEKLITSDPVNLTTQEFIKPGETAGGVLSFGLSPLPDDAADVEYRLVFRGRLGQEDDAIAVGIVEPASGFIVKPSYVPTDGITGNRLIVKNGGKWRLTEDRDLEGGNIDWKGWYENGRPTKVLSWSGPKARHFPDFSGDPFTVYVYQGGERFAFAPGRVLGAAIGKDAEGNEWLLVICKYGNADAVFRRPNKPSNSPISYDPVTNPDGWQLIGRFPWATDFEQPNRPWFFNGDGTEAQTIREVQIGSTETNTIGFKTTRLRITISNADAAFLEDLGNLDGLIANSTRVQRTIKGTASCSISFEQSAESTGAYVVAVDYKDMKEVVCELRSHSVTSTSNTMKTVGNRAVNEVRTYVVDDATDISEILSCDGTEFELYRRANTDSTELSRTISGITGNSEFHYHSKVHFIDYLDSRYDLLVTLFRESKDDRVLTPVGDGRGVGFGESQYTGVGSYSFTTVERDVVNYGGKILTASEFTRSFASSEGLVYFAIIAGSCIPEDRTEVLDSRFYPAVELGSRTEGSWVVDSNGHLAVSQTKGANHVEGGQVGTGEFYNFVTGGKLEAAIPGGPEDAHYFPMYVIK